LSQDVTGAFLNALGILLGGLFGLALRRPLSVRVQLFIRSALGVLTVFFGLRLVWLSVNGTFLSGLKQILIALLAVMVGSLLGKLLGLQKISNQLGRYAGNILTAGPSGVRHNPGDGFSACAILFCVAPLGLIGAVADGLSNYFYLLAVKAVMDGLATLGSVKTLGWPVALSAFPVFLFLGVITLLCRLYAVPFLASYSPGGDDLVNSVNIVAGLVSCAVALVIFQVRKVALANYLPGLVVAPLLAWLFSH
jgi:uncharacterized membrane protein YqgA involved in biofilm formation